MQRHRNQSTNVRRGQLNRARSVDSARVRRRQRTETSPEPKSLEEAGYHFNENGKLVSIVDGKPFEFYMYSNREDNQRRYNVIGRLMDDDIYARMERHLQLRRVPIPLHAKNSEPTGFIFASDDALCAEYLMIIIHGMGVVRAGQWSRKLIINESLEVGSQLEYIQRARGNNYAVIVTNTNLNTDESSKSILRSPRPIRGSSCAEEHGCYVWENFVRKSSARHICIVAHSYGGAVVLELAARYTSEFDKRVFAVALTDSPMTAYTKQSNANVLKMLHKRTINWIADSSRTDTPLRTREYGQLRSAGHLSHEWTSHMAFDSIFKFFQDERTNLERAKH